jgi:spermidine synthase
VSQAGKSSHEVALSTPSGPEVESTQDTNLVLGPWLIYVTAAVLGFTFFALELVWYRMLAPILGGTAFTFGLILCVALLGIGVGGIAYNFVFHRIRPSWSALAVTCGCEAVLIIVPFALGDRLALLAASQAESAQSFAQLVFGWSYITSIVVLPVALVSGLQFPLLTGVLGHGRTTVSEHLGNAYAWNTLGAIAGSLVVGFGAMPLLGAPGLWRAIAATLSVLSLCILAAAPRPKRRAALIVAGLCFVTLGSMIADGPTAVWRHSGIGAGRAPVPRTDLNRRQQWINEKRHILVWDTDGVECGVGIQRQDGFAFVVDGKSDGNALGDAATQMGAAISGAVLHPDPRTALVIGLGTGESAGWLAKMRNVERVDVVELEPAIDEMALRCSELNQDVLNNPRVRRIYNDGREFVFTSDNTYDVVISEPSNPYRAGIAALYTTEFYQTVRERLEPGGIFIQWMQAYEVDDATVSTVLATVRTAFEHVEIWQTMAMDLQLVCSNTPIRYSTDELRRRIDSAVVRDALVKAWNVDDAEGFLARFVSSAQWTDEIARNVAVDHNTDDRTVLEYSFAKTVGRQAHFSIEGLRNRLRPAGYHRPLLDDNSIDWNAVETRRQQFNLVFQGQLSLDGLSRTEDRALVEAFDRYQKDDFAGAIDIWPQEHREPSDNVQRLLLARCYAELARPESLELIVAAEQQFPNDAAAVRAIYHTRAGDTVAATQSLQQFFTQLASDPWMIRIISQSAFYRAIDVAEANRDSAQQIYASLSQPLASHRLDYMRQIARVMVAVQLGPEKVAEALADLEPHVTWTANILKPRAEAYAALKHPLAARAESDWQWFEQHRTDR